MKWQYFRIKGIDGRIYRYYLHPTEKLYYVEELFGGDWFHMGRVHTLGDHWEDITEDEAFLEMV